MDISVEGFNPDPWRAERSGTDKGGGGLCLLFKSNLSPHPWTPPVPETHKYVEKERQWMLLEVGRERVAFLHCNIACQTSCNDDFLTWNEDLFQLLTQETISIRQQGFRVLAMGDFNSRIGQIRGLEGNTPDVNRNGPMFTSFIEQASLVIINTLPIAKGLFTRFIRRLLWFDRL